MTGRKACLTNYVESSSACVTFGDGVKDKVIGSGTLNVKDMPWLTDVLPVE